MATAMVMVLSESVVMIPCDENSMESRAHRCLGYMLTVVYGLVPSMPVRSLEIYRQTWSSLVNVCRTEPLVHRNE